jgi:integrase
MLLTDNRVRAVAPPRKGRKEVGDTDVRGLVLRVTANGARSWSVCYKVKGDGGVGKRGTPRKGVQRRITLGDAATIPVEDARDRARALMRQVGGGVDPRPALRREAEQRQTNTVANVTTRMVEASKKTVSSWRVMDTVLRVHVVPKLGARPVADLTRAELFNFLDDLKVKKSIATAREARKHLGRLLNWCAVRGIVPVNPIAGARDKDLNYKPREHVLTDAELRAAWIAADSLGYPYKQAARLLILTGQRKREILHASWPEIDRAERTLLIPPERHKQGRAHLVPLSDPAWEIVSELPRKRGQRALFLTRSDTVADMPSTIAEKWIAATAAQLKKDDTDFDAKEWTPFMVHDLRRSCKTRLAKLRIRPDVRDAVLGHARAGMDRTYNHHDYLDEKREALDKYAAHVLELAR